MTYAEYKALQEKQRMKASFNLRKPNEGREDASWKKMVPLKKEDGGEEVVSEEDEEEVRNTTKINK